jgi:hypothetical protein
LQSFSSESAPIVQKRKRGRPPKLNKTPTSSAKGKGIELGIANIKGLTLDLYSDESDFIESDAENGKRRRSHLESFEHTLDLSKLMSPSAPSLLDPAASVRRSHRGRKLDPTRTLTVLWPGDDPRTTFDVRSEADWESLQLALSADILWDLSDQESEHDLPLVDKTHVQTPRVIERPPMSFSTYTAPTNSVSNSSTNSRSTKGVSSTRRKQYAQNKPSYDYSAVYEDYDANSEDEALMHNLALQLSGGNISTSQNITPRLFERLICRLERELELFRCFSQSLSETSAALQHANSTINDSIDIYKLAKKKIQVGNATKSRDEDNNAADVIINDNADSAANTTASITSASSSSEGGMIRKSNSTNSLQSLASSSNNPNPSTSADTSISNVVTNKLFQAISWEDIHTWIPEDRAMALLLPILQSASTNLTHEDQVVVIKHIYSHWVHKTIGRKQSLLRTYHRFRMHIWQSVLNSTSNNAFDTTSITSSSSTAFADYSTKSLLHAYSQLQRLRRDLDRGRLIVDRLRRREKMKKEYVRTCIDDITNVYGLASGDNSGNNASLNARKRGRPRRADSLSSLPDTPRNYSTPSTTSTTPLARASTTPSITSSSVTTPTIKYVQGRDRFGKFLKKTAVIVMPAADSAASIEVVGTSSSKDNAQTSVQFNTDTTASSSNSSESNPSSNAGNSVDRSSISAADSDLTFALCNEPFVLPPDNEDDVFTNSFSSTLPPPPPPPSVSVQTVPAYPPAYPAISTYTNPAHSIHGTLPAYPTFPTHPTPSEEPRYADLDLEDEAAEILLSHLDDDFFPLV